MAGHSKWANIKRQKERVDAKRGAIFTKLSRDIIVAARSGLPDPSGNFQLRTAIDRAKAAGMPNENIERAIAKGSGAHSDSAALESIRYEGYGPGGVAVLVEAVTDNRNRTAADLRLAFSKNGGNLGETGCVSWMFSQKGVVSLNGACNEDALLEDCAEVGAESYELTDEGAEVVGAIAALEAMATGLKGRGYAVRDAELRWIPGTSTPVEEADQGRSLLKLIDALEELDDVQSVTSNFEMSDDLIAELSA